MARSGSTITPTQRPFAACLVACAALVGGCSWHHIDARQVAPATRVATSVGIAAADAKTSLNDLRAIAGSWSAWGAFDRVQFPYREGDPVDLVVEVRLRQRADQHRGSNSLRVIAVGLSLGLLSPFIGAQVTEIHDVSVRCLRGQVSTGPLEQNVATTATFAVGANAVDLAKELDEEQMKRLAADLLEIVVRSCGAAAPGRGDGSIERVDASDWRLRRAFTADVRP